MEARHANSWKERRSSRWGETCLHETTELGSRRLDDARGLTHAPAHEQEVVRRVVVQVFVHVGRGDNTRRDSACQPPRVETPHHGGERSVFMPRGQVVTRQHGVARVHDCTIRTKNLQCEGRVRCFLVLG